MFFTFFQCKERYEKAAILLRSLEDGARSDQDRALLDKCILLFFDVVVPIM